MMMRTIWIAAAVCGLIGHAAFERTALAQADEDAQAVLTESAAAIKRVEGVQYEVKTYATGMLKDIIDLSGSVKMWRPPGSASLMWRVDGRAKNPGKGDRKLTVVSDGTTVKWVDHENGRVIERPRTDSEAMETANLCRELVLEQWGSDVPFQMELQSYPILTKTGIQSVGGEVCDVVTAMPETKDRNRTWAIGVKDRLPRSIDMGTGQTQASVHKITELSGLKVMTFTRADFELVAADAPVAPKEAAPKIAAATPPAAPRADPVPVPVASAPEGVAQAKVEEGGSLGMMWIGLILGGTLLVAGVVGVWWMMSSRRGAGR